MFINTYFSSIEILAIAHFDLHQNYCIAYYFDFFNFKIVHHQIHHIASGMTFLEILAFNYHFTIEVHNYQLAHY